MCSEWIPYQDFKSSPQWSAKETWKTEGMHKLCVDILTEVDWHLPDKSSEKAGIDSITPTRNHPC